MIRGESAGPCLRIRRMEISRREGHENLVRPFPPAIDVDCHTSECFTHWQRLRPGGGQARTETSMPRCSAVVEIVPDIASPSPLFSRPGVPAAPRAEATVGLASRRGRRALVNDLGRRLEVGKSLVTSWAKSHARDGSTDGTFALAGSSRSVRNPSRARCPRYGSRDKTASSLVRNRRTVDRFQHVGLRPARFPGR